MKKIKEQKCIFCSSKFRDKSSLYDHIDVNHSSSIPNDMSIPQYLFNLKYKKEFGTCVICKGRTKWNESTERYDRLCSERCKEDYKKAFQKRMIDKHGKIYLTQDPDHQRKMLANRKISGKYQWSDGISEVGYTGSYELEFLKFLDIVMNFNATDIISPAPQNFYYKDDKGKERFYFPDFFIPSLNLIIEIKDGGDNPNKHHKIQEVDKKLEKIKDDIMRKQKDFNYVKVANNNFSDFINYLIDLRQQDTQRIKTPLIRINESYFDKIASKLLKESKQVCTNNEQLLDKYYSLFMENVNKMDLDHQLYIEPEKDKRGKYIQVDNRYYALKEEKMFPLNNAHEFKTGIRHFNKCPLHRRKELAKNLYKYSEEHGFKIPSSSSIWNYIPEKIHKLNEGAFHDKLKSGNDRTDIYHIKHNEVESLPEINNILDNINEENIYLSSDWHLFQKERKNIFTNAKVENINEILINNQKRVVGKDDVFIFLGDLVNDEFIAKDELILKVSQLHGYKILVLGNNDVFEEEFYSRCGFNVVVKSFKWKNLIFTHAPIDVPSEYINVHGHIHGSRSYINTSSSNHIDVYADLYSYKPISLSHAKNLYHKGFYKGQDFAPSDYHFDKTFMRTSLSENYDFGLSVSKAKEMFNVLGARVGDEGENSFELFKLMGRKRTAIVTNLKGSLDNKGGYYAVNYGKCLISPDNNTGDLSYPIYILGLLNTEIEEGIQVYVNIIGCVERQDGTEILIGKYIHNKREYNKLQIATLIYPQERHHNHDIYLYDEKSKLTQIADVEHSYLDIHSEEFMSRLIESVSLDVDGNILIQMKQESDFMAKYMTSHRLLKIYEKTNSYENIKNELCKLYYMIIIIETYYVKPKKTNPISAYFRSKKLPEVIKAKGFILNDFNKYLTLILEKEPNFVFSDYFAKTEYYKDVIKITPSMVNGIKTIFQSIVF